MEPLGCPQGVATCNDVSITNLLVLIFPIAVPFAVLIAWPVARFAPRRRLLGGVVALVATFAYLYFSSSAAAISLAAFVLGIIGLALLMGRRANTPPSEGP